ncbi:hypothetical protein ILYODFUR_035843 [Ilyodon furcidens]|uniref:Uncharacterized protein n=1 Tax=Ilyodon furcidens TaxID=33524 RepID=A0ABV0T2Z7_9TELE
MLQMYPLVFLLSGNQYPGHSLFQDTDPLPSSDFIEELTSGSTQVNLLRPILRPLTILPIILLPEIFIIMVIIISLTSLPFITTYLYSSVPTWAPPLNLEERLISLVSRNRLNFSLLSVVVACTRASHTNIMMVHISVLTKR